MDKELTRIASDNSSTTSWVYQMALQVATNLVKDPLFRAMFLRAESYDALRAAHRLIQFLQYKMELFGVQKLGKTITINEDLTDEDRNYLYEGGMQLLKEKDASGRTVFCNIVKPSDDGGIVNIKSKLRVLYYLTMSALEDEEAQKRGLVFLTYALQPLCSTVSVTCLFDANILEAFARLRRILPARYESVHYSFTQDSFKPYIQHDIHFWDNELRAKISLHQASPMELQFELQLLGIPAGCLPVSILGDTIKVNDHEAWLEARKFKELLENGDGSMDDDELFSGFMVTKREADPMPPRLDVSSLSTRSQNFDPTCLSQPNGAEHFSACLLSNIGACMGTHSWTQLSSDDARSTFLHKDHKRSKSESSQGELLALNKQPPKTRPTSSLSNPDKVNKFDVLFGRGKVKDHYGNVHLHRLISKHRHRYEAAERWEKTVISEEIVSIIRNDLGGRFLKQTRDQSRPWVEVDLETAREKVSHAFRSRRLKRTTLPVLLGKDRNEATL